jgi:hypothetical protein
VNEIEDLLRHISELNDNVKVIEEQITDQTEILKGLFIKSSSAMKESQSYLLTGIQAAPISKAYLVTFRGIEVLGEEIIPIPLFIDSVIRFANYPKRKIEVLKELAAHLKKINDMIRAEKDASSAEA